MRHIRFLPLLLALVLLLSACGGQQQPEQKTQLERTAEFLEAMVPEPGFGSMAGDWVVFGLARAGLEAPKDYVETYCKNVEDHVKNTGGKLTENAYTEYSRLILAWSAIGRDVRNVGGYNLLMPLADQKRTQAQGVNGIIFALLALDCGGYEIPENPEAGEQATREGYLAALLAGQNEDGGWSLTGGTSDPDLTAMALQALAGYQSRADVSEAISRALACLAAMQQENGTFLSWGAENCESVCQVIVALTQLGLSPDEARFVKNDQTLEDVLLRFAQEDGGFSHLPDGESDPVASTQAFYTLAAIERFRAGKTPLYDMSDIVK